MRREVRAAGAPSAARTGSRYARSSSWKCASTMSRLAASGMAPSSCAGGRTSRQGNAPTISFRRPRRMSDKLLHPDRQVADALARRMEDRIGDCSGGADIAQFTKAFDARRVHLVVLLGQEEDVDLVDIGIHRHQIVGEIVIDVAGIARVDLGRLMQSR